VLASGALMLNQVLIAEGRETRLVAPWGIALAAAVAVLFLAGGDPSLRVTIALVAGQVAALIGVIITIASRRSRAAAPASGSA
jgi:hypothetical protein